MKKSCYTESQIIKFLHEVEDAEWSRICAVSKVYPNDLFHWKSKYGGLIALDVKNIKKLEDENRRLKRIYADFSLQIEGLKNVIKGKFWVQLRNASWLIMQETSMGWTYV